MALTWRQTMLVALLLQGCTGVATVQLAVATSVRAELADTLPGAQVTTSNPSLHVESSNGSLFNITGISAGEQVVLTASAPGYTSRTLTLHPPTNGSQILAMTITLRPVDQTTHITLPAAGEAAVQASVTKVDGQALLTIAAGSMVDPNGQVAAGDANVRLTYWHPGLPLFTAPGALLTADANGSAQPLRSYGMAAIEVEQNGTLLQIAPGQTLPLAFTLPVNMRGMIGDPHAPQPDLYYMNHKTGLWDDVGGISSGALAWNPNTGIITAALPHLSEWNIDGLDVANRGCVKGTATDACTGGALKNTKIAVWFMAWEELDLLQTSTDATGSYCVSYRTRDYSPSNPMGDADMVPIMISGTDTPRNSNLCAEQAIPDLCVGCAGVGPDQGIANECCRYQVDYQVNNAANGNPFYPPEAGGGGSCCNGDLGGATCTNYSVGVGFTATPIPTAVCQSVCPAIKASAFTPCHICPGESPPNGDAQCWATLNASGNSSLTQNYDNDCVDLDSVYGGPIAISDGTCPPPAGGSVGCTAKPAGTACATAADCCDPKLDCNANVCSPPCSPKQAGQDCVMGLTPDDCCAPNVYVCGDHVCVPPIDSPVTDMIRRPL